MKKIIAVAAAAIIAAGLSFAQVTVGAKGAFDLDVGTEDKASMTGTFTVSAAPSAGIYARYELPFVSGLGVQAECNYYFNNNATFAYTNKAYTAQVLRYASVDIPVLAAYGMKAGPVDLTFTAGPYVSFVIGNLYHTYVGNDKEFIENVTTPVIFGVTGAVEASYKVGPGSVAAGLSYINDFSPVEIEEYGSVFIRRALVFSCGYEIAF